jgi:hypothetical protein
VPFKEEMEQTSFLVRSASCEGCERFAPSQKLRRVVEISEEHQCGCHFEKAVSLERVKFERLLQMISRGSGFARP